MTEPEHRITTLGGKVAIECLSCGAGMEVSKASIFGDVMIEKWPETHKCYKPKGRKP